MRYSILFLFSILLLLGESKSYSQSIDMHQRRLELGISKPILSYKSYLPGQTTITNAFVPGIIVRSNRELFSLTHYLEYNKTETRSASGSFPFLTISNTFYAKSAIHFNFGKKWFQWFIGPGASISRVDSHLIPLRGFVLPVNEANPFLSIGINLDLGFRLHFLKKFHFSIESSGAVLSNIVSNQFSRSFISTRELFYPIRHFTFTYTISDLK